MVLSQHCGGTPNSLCSYERQVYIEIRTVIHFRVRNGAQTFMARDAQAFMAQAKAYQYTFIMVFAKGMFREGARDGPVCFMVVWHEWYATGKTERGSSARKDGCARLAVNMPTPCPFYYSPLIERCSTFRLNSCVTERDSLFSHTRITFGPAILYSAPVVLSV